MKELAEAQDKKRHRQQSSMDIQHGYPLGKHTRNNILYHDKTDMMAQYEKRESSLGSKIMKYQQGLKQTGLRNNNNSIGTIKGLPIQNAREQIEQMYQSEDRTKPHQTQSQIRKNVKQIVKEN